MKRTLDLNRAGVRAQSSESNDLIQKLDQDIARYSKLAYDTRLERNSHLPISRLPTEVLCRIFLLLRGSRSWRYSNISSWIYVSHVCARWRSVALGEPTLWTNPPLDSYFWTITMLERSRMAGLTITIRPHTPFSVITAVIQHMSHITKLTLNYQYTHDMQIILQLMADTPTPVLEILSLGFVHLDQISQDTLFRFPSNVMIAAPRLRHLKLRYITFDWSSPLFSSLTTLFLEDIAPSRRPSMAQLMSILRKIPELRSLTLRRALPVGGLDARHDSAENQWRFVQLPHLEVVTLVGYFSQIQAFTGSIALSSSISFVELSFIHDNHFELGTLISDLTKAYCNSKTHCHACLQRDEPYDSLDLIFAPYSETSRLQISINQFNEPGMNNQDLDFECDEKIYTHFFQSFNWTSLVRLNMNYLPSTSMPSTRLMALTFGSLPSIRTVVVSLSTASYFMEVLSLELDGDLTCGNSSGISIAFPGLREIEMINVSFFNTAKELSSGNSDKDSETRDHSGLDSDEADSQEEEVEDDDNDDFEDDGVPIETAKFIQCLESRARRGVPICKLGMERCSIAPETDKQTLRHAVPDIDWGICDSVSVFKFESKPASRLKQRWLFE